MWTTTQQVTSETKKGEGKGREKHRERQRKKRGKGHCSGGAAADFPCT